MARFHNVRMRMIDGHIEAERLQQNVLVEDQIVGVLIVERRIDFGEFLILQRKLHLDDGLDFARLLFDFGG